MRMLIAGGLWMSCAVAASAATASPISDVRLGVDVMTHVKVKESTSGPTGSATYDWHQGGLTNNLGMRYELAYFHGQSYRTRAEEGLLWTAGVNYTSFETTAERFGGVANPRSDVKTHFQQFGVMGGGGYATPPESMSLGEVHGEILLLARVGLAEAETQTDKLTDRVARGTLPWGEASVRSGIIVQDNGYLADVHLGYAYGLSKGSVDGGQGVTSDLTITTSSLYIGVAVGARF